jgi:hypothetical protein
MGEFVARGLSPASFRYPKGAKSMKPIPTSAKGARPPPVTVSAKIPNRTIRQMPSALPGFRAFCVSKKIFQTFFIPTLPKPRFQT